MQTLYNLVTDNYQLYGALTDEKDVHTVVQLKPKLQYLENENLHQTGSSINISPPGSVFIRNYPPQLLTVMNLV